MKEKIKKHIKRCCIIAAITLVICGIFELGLNSKEGKYQYMNQLDYEVTLKDNGDMDVVETWDIYLKNTNTVFRNFELSDKFGMITNITVTDLETGKQLSQINEKMYHVTTDCFCAFELDDNKFEIAWGTGMEELKGIKKYQVKYTVTDVVTQYNDCQEIYWKFLDSINKISCEKVNIKIILPKQVQKIDNLLIWGHGPLNGVINKTSNRTVEAEINGLEAGTMLEVRLVTKEKIFNNVSADKNKDYVCLDKILGEETKWAYETNVRALIYKTIKFIALGIYATIVIVKAIRIIKIIVYNNAYNKKEIINNKLQYFRDIPRENESTPAEASYLYNFQKDASFSLEKKSNVIAGTILNLCLKGYIALRTEDETVYVKILKKSKGLSNDEKDVYTLLVNASNGKVEFDMKDLGEYAKKHYSKYFNIVFDIFHSSINNLYKIGLLDKNEEKLYIKAKNVRFSSWINLIEDITIPTIIFTTVFRKALKMALGLYSVLLSTYFMVLLLLIVCAIETKLLLEIKGKITILTQKGEEESEQWKGLANYIKDYSLLKEKEIKSLAIWEKYLVFATTFGIAKEALKEMEAEYPEVFIEKYWEDNKDLIDKYPVIKISTFNFYDYVGHTHSIDIIRYNINRAYNASLTAHTSSSGYGGGGGFSIGGGGRWRSEVGMGGR